MKYFKILVFVLLVISLAFVIFTYVDQKHKSIEVPKTDNSIGQTKDEMPDVEIEKFTWAFEDSDEKNLDGLPKTNVFLDVEYIDGQKGQYLVDTVHGGCNELLGDDEERLKNTELVQCYAAGLGFRYKIVKDNNSYNVLRQEFEEASPDYNPPMLAFETIMEFPFVSKVSDENQADAILTDGRKCYVYSHEATPEAPYTVSEHLDIVISGDSVSGTKKGNQSGPDMTNGYTGTITGNIVDGKIEAVFAFTVEGSSNKEAEIYQTSDEGLEKLRYPLVEGEKMLVPDKTKEFSILSYDEVSCESFL